MPCTTKPAKMMNPHILWAYLRPATQGGSRKTIPVDLHIKPEATGIEFQLLGEGTESVCTCPDCSLWLFVAHTCRCCGMRERRLFGNRKKQQEAEKKFKDKHGLLRSVEAGDNVRDLGRVDLAFQNGDMLSIGVCCKKEYDDKMFCSIVDAIKDTAGVVLCQETRCQAHRRSGDKTKNKKTADASDIADAERHMQELLAMEDGRPKGALETPASPARRSQHKGKGKSEGKSESSTSSQVHKAVNSQDVLVELNEDTKEYRQQTDPVVALGAADIPEHSVGDSSVACARVEDLPAEKLTAIARRSQNKGKRKSQPSATALSFKERGKEERANEETPHASDKEKSPQQKETADASQTMVVEEFPDHSLGELGAATIEVEDLPWVKMSLVSGRSQHKGKKKNQPATPASTHKVGTHESSYKVNENQENPQEAQTALPLESAAIAEHVLGESKAEAAVGEDYPQDQPFVLEEEMQFCSEIVPEKASGATDFSAFLDTCHEFHELHNPNCSSQNCTSCNCSSSYGDVDDDCQDSFSCTNRWLFTNRDCKLTSLEKWLAPAQGDVNENCQASIDWTGQWFPESIDCQAYEQTLLDHCFPACSAASDSGSEQSQGECSRKCEVLQSLGPPPSYAPPPPPPPPPPLPSGRDIKIQASPTSEASSPAAAVASLLDVQVAAAPCVLGDNITRPLTCSAPPGLYDDLDDPLFAPPGLYDDLDDPSFALPFCCDDLEDPVLASCAVRDNITSAAFIAPPKPFNNFANACNWSSMEPAWSPMQSKLGMWTASKDMFFCTPAH